MKSNLTPFIPLWTENYTNNTTHSVQHNSDEMRSVAYVINVSEILYTDTFLATDKEF